MLFQRKVFPVSYLIAIVVGFLLGGKPQTIGFCFLAIAPMIQYYSYDIKDKNQYYYFYNLGLSEIHLWFSTVIIGIINLVILSFL